MWFAANLSNEAVSARIRDRIPVPAERTLSSQAETPEEDLLAFSPHGFLLVRE